MTVHDKIWKKHPAVSKGEKLSIGQRSADHMKGVLATWPALILVSVSIVAWMVTNGGGIDKSPWILLNLCLSCFAALQCFVLLIANKRGEQIAAEIAQHTYENTQKLTQLLEENTTLTATVNQLTTDIHTHIMNS
jgi:uncharacterized membrane protein